jgi:mannose-6-phosphate isomerase
VELLHGVVRPYAWGSRSVIARIQGRHVPSDGPEAELWLGAHPGGPSTVERPGGSVSLGDLVAAEPDRLLGPAVTAAFGARLPYLLKVLAADAPLSLQAHPDPEQARAGYAAGHPCYVDDSHKPELLVAVTPFDALCGFRPPDVSAAVLEAFELPELAPVVAALRAGASGLRDAVRILLTWPAPQRPALVQAVVRAAGGAGADHPYAAAFALVEGLAEHHPEDPGVLVALLLHHVCLEPGEAIWMPAGNLHAYLSGAGVEVMAASDNVLRGGLTAKRVDVDELLRVLRFEVLDDPVVPARAVQPGVTTWPVPVREFALHRVMLDTWVPRVRLAVDGPRIVLCLSGEVTADDGGGPVAVPAGAAAFAPPGAALVLAGAGEAYVASVPV